MRSAAVEKGFSALKMGGSQGPVRFVDTPKAIDTMVARVAAVREAVGDEVDIAVDLHRRFSPTMATIFVKELEPLRPLFAEEPCHPENNEPAVGFIAVNDRADCNRGTPPDAMEFPRGDRA